VNDAELTEHLHARGWSLAKIDVAMIREGAAAIQADALAAIKALQDRIDTLNSSLECEKRMRKDSDERMENAEAALKAARVQAREEAAALVENFPHWLGDTGKREIADAIRRMGEEAGKP
jgi:broad-specificity NMP kinase